MRLFRKSMSLIKAVLWGNTRYSYKGSATRKFQDFNDNIYNYEEFRAIINDLKISDLRFLA